MGALLSRPRFQVAVTALVESDVSPDNEEFWDDLWKIPITVDEVFKYIVPKDARKLREERFDNLCTLISQATAQMCQIGVTPDEKYFEQILTCIRVVTRLLPIMLEKEDLEEVDENVELFCWGTPDEILANRNETNDAVLGMTLNTSPATDISAPDSQNKDDEQDKLIAEAHSPLPPLTLDGVDDQNPENDDGTVDSGEEEEPIAVLIVHAAMEMLFLRGFGVEYDERDGFTNILKFKEPVSARPEFRQLLDEVGISITFIDDGLPIHPDEPSMIWTTGLLVEGNLKAREDGSTTGRSVTAIAASALSSDKSAVVPIDETLAFRRKYDRRRFEVLRLLLSACCGPIYCTAENYNPTSSRWLSLLTATNTPHASTLFYSLMNTVFNFDPAEYQSMIYSGASEFREDHVKLVEMSAQLLCILLDWGLPGSPDQVYGITGEPAVDAVTADKDGFNVHRTLLARINREDELKFLFEGFVRLLKNAYEVNMSIIPTSTAVLGCFQELIVLLWKTIEENPLFFSYVLRYCDVNQLIVPICYLMNVSRKDPSRNNMVHISTFILLKFSSEREFGMALREPMSVRLPGDLPKTSGGHLDLIANTLWSCMMDGHYKLEALYEGFLTIIQNIAPFWSDMGLITAMRLVTLFAEHSKHRYLYNDDEDNYSRRYLEMLLYTFNTIIHYQYHTNPALVYALVRGKKFFDRISTLTMDKAKADMGKNLDTIAEEEEEEDFEDEFGWTILEEDEEDDEIVQESKQPTDSQSKDGDVSPSGEEEEKKEDDDDGAGTADRRTIEDAGDAADVGSTVDAVEVQAIDSEKVTIEQTVTAADGIDAAPEEGKLDESNVAASAADATTQKRDSPAKAADKDKGKMLHEPAPGIVPRKVNSFEPTEEWLEDLMESLPIDTVARLVRHAHPIVDTMISENNDVIDDGAIMKALQKTTFVGLLPVPHPIVVQKFNPNQYTPVWITAYLWGVVFLRNQEPPLFDGECVRLFQVSAKVENDGGESDDDSTANGDDDDDDVTSGVKQKDGWTTSMEDARAQVTKQYEALTAGWKASSEAQ